MDKDDDCIVNEQGIPCDEEGRPYYGVMKRSEALALIFAMMTPIEPEKTE